MNEKRSSDEIVPQADRQAHTEIAERAGREGEHAAGAEKEGKTSSDKIIPQADKQAHTEIAERVGRDSSKQQP